MAKTKPIPDGYHSLTPYLIVKGGAKALDFYKKAFGAEELVRMPQPEGKIGHAEMRIGDSTFMLADEFPERDIRAPQGPPPVHLVFYCENVDAMFKRALAAGGKETRPLQDQFYGDRSGTLSDPFGHQWTVATHVEDVSPDEMKRRMAQQK
jgi:PhnB protein